MTAGHYVLTHLFCRTFGRPWYVYVLPDGTSSGRLTALMGSVIGHGNGRPSSIAIGHPDVSDKRPWDIRGLSLRYVGFIRIIIIFVWRLFHYMVKCALKLTSSLFREEIDTYTLNLLVVIRGF